MMDMQGGVVERPSGLVEHGIDAGGDDRLALWAGQEDQQLLGRKKTRPEPTSLATLWDVNWANTRDDRLCGRRAR